jgi:hypothetical protein
LQLPNQRSALLELLPFGSDDFEASELRDMGAQVGEDPVEQSIGVVLGVGSVGCAAELGGMRVGRLSRCSPVLRAVQCEPADRHPLRSHRARGLE